MLRINGTDCLPNRVTPHKGCFFKLPNGRGMIVSGAGKIAREGLGWASPFLHPSQGDTNNPKD